MDFKKIDDIKKTITFLLENGEFADIETAYNISMNALNDIDELYKQYQDLQLLQTGVMACCSKNKKEYKDYIGKEFIYKSKITRAETWFKVIAHFERAGRTVLISENNNGYYLDEVRPYNKP